MQKFDITIYLGFKTYLNSSQCFQSWELEFKCSNYKQLIYDNAESVGVL